MSIVSYLIYFLLALILSASLVPVLLFLSFRWGILDQPNERKIHHKPTPLLGGLAIFFSFFIVLLISRGHLFPSALSAHHWIGFFSGAFILVLGGILDDKYNLKPRWQIIFPILAVVAVLCGGIEIPKISNPFGGLIYLNWSFLSGALITLWLLGMMYTTKLLDGVDGLVSGLGVIGALIIFLFTISTRYLQPDIAWAAWIFAGAALGFLIFNWHPASIFLGEGGSLLIGYVLGVLAIISGGKIAIALLIMGVPILDVAWTIIRRLAKKKNPFRFADKNHLHHRLLAAGLSQKQTVLVFYALAFFFGLSGLFLQSRGKVIALAIVFVLMFVLVAFLSRLKTRKPRLLLHVCCAPCAAYITHARLMQRFRVTWYFYNSNLCSIDEYQKRLAAVKTFCRKYGIKLIIEPYIHQDFLASVKGRETDQEKGERCLVCYRDRLKKTAALARGKGYDFFSTSLLTSPYKLTSEISLICSDLSEEFGVKYLDEDFQADNGFILSQEFAKQENYYRQNFCGCEFSKKIISLLFVFTLSLSVIGFHTPKVFAAGEEVANASSSATYFVNDGLADSDGDGLNDQDETSKYLTDPNNFDTDGDGYSDGEEVLHHYSPLVAQQKMSEVDSDKDGLNDELELRLGTDMGKADSDGDGFSDFTEFDSAHDPLSPKDDAKLSVRAEVDLSKQKLSFFVGGIKWKEFIVSSGKASTPTPKGKFKITNKSLKAWSSAYHLWMPYWMGLGNGKVGLHELPMWPNGYREGTSHLGKPVSHGCVRLGLNDAKYLFDRLPVGTEVIIK
ncbi:MAG: epoxyqueuosine reductase QueH [Candidatus Falkowbacteria bacterium]|nr:epoxyqueuosine reductase QueH [Candidatus Falkowbacteria bacterium]